VTGTNEDRTHNGTQRFSVQQAADVLGISTEATRQRIKRGTLPTERDDDGNVFVLLAAEQADGTRTTDDGTHTNDDRTNDGTAALASLVASQEDQIEFLRQQLHAEREANRENRRLLAAALERIPAIEAPAEPHPEARESDLTASEGPESSTAPQEQQEPKSEPEPEQRRSWLYRFFFGP
jgi:hypothetical protein